MAGEAVTAMIVAADAGDNPLTDRREDREAAAERERKAKVAKVASQSTNAIAAVPYESVNRLEQQLLSTAPQAPVDRSR